MRNVSRSFPSSNQRRCCRHPPFSLSPPPPERSWDHTARNIWTLPRRIPFLPRGRCGDVLAAARNRTPPKVPSVRATSSHLIEQVLRRMTCWLSWSTIKSPTPLYGGPSISGEPWSCSSSKSTDSFRLLSPPLPSSPVFQTSFPPRFVFN